MQPNGLPFSCRERIWQCFQKSHNLAREAVGWNGGLGARGQVVQNL
jgi:hypothetical protein